MKFYVAGKFEDRGNVRKLMDKLENLGHAITFDWTTEHYQHKEETPEDAEECAVGVQICNVYIGRFIEKNNYKGALVEFGIALGLNKRIFIIGHAVDSCIFTNHPNVQRFETELEYLSYIKQVLK